MREAQLCGSARYLYPKCFCAHTTLQNQSQHSDESKQQQAEQQQQQQQVGPEDTDRIVAELRYRNIAVPKALDISWQRRLENWAKSFMSFSWATVKFLQSIPPAIVAMARMTGPEWRTTLAGWWATIKHEAHHYWVGFRLFGLELRVASRLVWKQLQGHTLTRRERKQLTRTTADIFRMVPFSLFIIIPFAELLLPVALRLFPNMLPSTFQNQLKEEENLKKRLVVKMELARFLQETVGELAKDLKQSRTGQAADDARELYNLLKRVREGQPVGNEAILRFAKLFNDEITLDNMDRVHLITLCEFLGLTQIGTNEFLRMRLRTYLNDLKVDDMMIRHEGLDEMTEDELRTACRARGMSAPFGEGSRSILQQHLQDWLDLSLNKNVPPSLLLMSRAFKLTSQPQTAARDEDATAQSLRETIGLLQEDTISDLEMETFSDARSSPSKRLEYIKREEADLKREEEEEREQEREAEAARVKMELSQRQLDMVEARARATAKAVMLEAAAGVLQRAVDEGTATIESQSSDEQAYKAAAEKQHKMKKVIDALAMLASASGVSKERAIFMEVAKEEVGGMLDRFATKGGSQMYFDMLGLNVVRPPLESKEAAVTQQVSDYVSDILIRIEQDIDAVDSKIGEKLHLLDKDNDGIITRAELQEAIAFVKEELGQDELDSLLQLLGNDQSFSIKDLEVKIAANAKM